MYKKIFSLPIGILLFGLLTQDIYSQDTLKQRYDHPHYDSVWPFDLSFKKNFSMPDSIIFSNNGEIHIRFEFDTSGNIFNIDIYSVVLKKDGNIIYEYHAPVLNDENETWYRHDRDRLYYKITHIIHEYIYNEMKLTRNENPFFRERYHTVYTIRF